jgi:hypothetical protein
MLCYAQLLRNEKCSSITQGFFQNYIIMVCDNISVGSIDGVTSSKVDRI